jgi:hypothetical protein
MSFIKYFVPSSLFSGLVHLFGHFFLRQVINLPGIFAYYCRRTADRKFSSEGEQGLFSMLLGICLFLTSFVQAISIESLQGQEITPYAKELSSFFQKMYQNQHCYFSEEQWDKYIASYVNTEESVVSLALLDERIVGAVLGKPLAKASEKYKKPFFDHPDYLNSLFFLGDLEIQPVYRQHILQKKLYREFEKKVTQMGCYTGISLWQTQDGDQAFSAFFLKQQGFTHHPEFHFEELYKDTPLAEITPHYMTSWIKSLHTSSH